MGKLFEMIPKIYAGDLPHEVEDELMKWDEELCFHGDGGCVFRVSSYGAEELPLFINWMVKIGAWTSEQAANVKNESLAVAMTGT